jgi:transposase
MEKENETRTPRTRYDDQFKADAVRHVIESGKTIKSAAEDLGVERSNLGRWKREQLGKMDQQVGVGSEGMKPSEVEAELRRLRADFADMREQRDILKKALSVFAQKPRRGMSS